MAYKVFVSYSAPDRELVDSIRSAAHPLGIEVYSYHLDSQPGVNLSEKLISRINESDAVVVLLTEAGVASAAVNQEIGAAKQAGKMIVPIVESGVDPTRLTFLQGIEYETLDRTNIPATIIRLTGRLASLKSSAGGNGLLLFLLLIAALVLFSSSE